MRLHGGYYKKVEYEFDTFLVFNGNAIELLVGCREWDLTCKKYVLKTLTSSQP